MPQSTKQDWGFQSAANAPIVTTPPTPLTKGNKLQIVVMGNGTVDAQIPPDSLGNVYVLRSPKFTLIGKGTIYLFECQQVKAGTPTITITGTGLGAVFYELSADDPQASLDAIQSLIVDQVLPQLSTVKHDVGQILLQP